MTNTCPDCDGFLRVVCGYGTPTRNDCGYSDRYNHEDSSRMHGWGVEGEGACDYPDGCGWFKNGKCPFYNREQMHNNVCSRTGRLCIGGAFDGGDGYGIDCPSGDLKTCGWRDKSNDRHNITEDEPAYPTCDKADRQGIYCEHCGTIFYVPLEFSRRVIGRECPICRDSTLHWILMSKEFQPVGDGF